MRKKTFRKLRKIAERYYDLEVTRALGDGLGGSKPITPGDLNRHRRLKKFLYGHPNKSEYDKIISAESNAVALAHYGMTWDGGSRSYRRKLWKNKPEIQVNSN